MALQSLSACSSLVAENFSLFTIIRYSAELIPALSKSSKLL